MIILASWQARTRSLATFGWHIFNDIAESLDLSGTHPARASATVSTPTNLNLRAFSEINYRTVLLFIDHWDPCTLSTTRHPRRARSLSSSHTINRTAIWRLSCSTKNLAQKGEAVRRRNKAREGLRRYPNRNVWYSLRLRVSSA